MKEQGVKKDVFVILIIGVVVLLWFSNVIFSNCIFVYKDLARYFYPLRLFGTESVKSFHIPLWNPYVSCGKPFLAVLQTAVFYPLSIVFYVFPSFDAAFNWYVIIHFFLAGIFMYCLMRHWKFSRIASFASGVLFVCSGYLSSVISMNSTLSSVVWTPVILLFFDKALRIKKLRYILLTAVFLGFQFLGGIPTPVYCTMWILFFYSLGFIWVEYRRQKTGFLPSFRTEGRRQRSEDRRQRLHAEDRRRAFCRPLGQKTEDRRQRLEVKCRGLVWPIFVFIMVFVIFGLLFMFQILPFGELVDCSNLVSGRSFEAVSKWSVTPIEVLSFVFPYIRGNINVPSGHLGPQEWLPSIYIGVPAVVLTIILFFVKPTKKAWFFGAVLLGSVVLALGKYTPVYFLLYKCLPGFSSMRYPVKFVFVSTFSFCILAGMGLETILNENRLSKKRTVGRWLIMINTVLAVFVVLFFVFWQKIGDWVMKWVFCGKGMTGDLFNKAVFVFLNDSRYFCQIFIVFTMVVILVLVFFRNRMSKNVFSGLLLALIIGDLIAVNMGSVKIMDRRWFSLEPFSVKEVNKDESLFRTFQTKDLWEINRSIYGLDYSAGMYDRKKTFACNTAMVYEIYSTRGYGSIEVKDWYDFLLFLDVQVPEIRMKLLGLLNVKYIFSVELFPDKELDLDVVYEDTLAHTTLLNGSRVYKKFYISKNPYYMNRAFLVDDACVVEDESVVLGIMQNESFDPKKVVLIDEEIPADIRYQPPVVSGKIPAKKEYADIVSYEPEEVIVKIYVNEPKWLVLSDTYYPGWKVYVDGKEDKVYKADYFLRAVWLKEEGEHVVKFVYSPLSFKVGTAISFVVFLGIIVFCVHRYRSRCLFVVSIL